MYSYSPHLVGQPDSQQELVLIFSLLLLILFSSLTPHLKHMYRSLTCTHTHSVKNLVMQPVGTHLVEQSDSLLKHTHRSLTCTHTHPVEQPDIQQSSYSWSDAHLYLTCCIALLVKILLSQDNLLKHTHMGLICTHTHPVE